jgi:replicative DNA helicase
MFDQATIYDFGPEQHVLGSILVNKDAYWRVADFLKPDHFADPLHGKLYRYFAGLIERGQPLSMSALKALAVDAAFAAVGGMEYAYKLTHASVPPADAETYGRLVAVAHLRHKAAEVARNAPYDDLGAELEGLGREHSVLASGCAKPFVDALEQRRAQPPVFPQG